MLVGLLELFTLTLPMLCPPQKQGRQAGSTVFSLYISVGRQDRDLALHFIPRLRLHHPPPTQNFLPAPLCDWCEESLPAGRRTLCVDRHWAAFLLHLAFAFWRRTFHTRHTYRKGLYALLPIPCTLFHISRAGLCS